MAIFRQLKQCDIILSMKWSNLTWSRVLKLMMLGAAGFWLPDTLLHALRGHEFNGRDVVIVTVVTPLTLLITFFLVKRRAIGCEKYVSLPILAGVWLFGGLFMMVGQTFSGGGLLATGGARLVLMTLLLSLFPMYTFIMATYDGSLGALLLVTAAAFIIWIIQWGLGFSRRAGIDKTQ
jgi:hypothetical protein